MFHLSHLLALLYHSSIPSSKNRFVATTTTTSILLSPSGAVGHTQKSWLACDNLFLSCISIGAEHATATTSISFYKQIALYAILVDKHDLCGTTAVRTFRIKHLSHLLVLLYHIYGKCQVAICTKDFAFKISEIVQYHEFWWLTLANHQLKKVRGWSPLLVASCGRILSIVIIKYLHVVQPNPVVHNYTSLNVWFVKG
jgi:hypothetical protein